MFAIIFNNSNGDFMSYSIQSHVKGYDLSFGEAMLTAFTLTGAPYAMRHGELSEQQEYAEYKVGHKVLMVVQCIPGVGLLAALVERIVVYVASLFKQNENEVKPNELPNELKPNEPNELKPNEVKLKNPQNNEVINVQPNNLIVPSASESPISVEIPQNQLKKEWYEAFASDPEKMKEAQKLENRLKDLEEYALTKMTSENWEEHCQAMRRGFTEKNKTNDELELEYFTELALKAIKTKSNKEKRDYVEPTPEELKEAIESIKRDQFVENLYKREKEDQVEAKLNKFYESKGANYAKTPLEIDVENFHGKKVYGEWVIDLNQEANVVDWESDKHLPPIDLDPYIDKKIELRQKDEEEGVFPPHPPFKITFRKAFQYIANKINECCTKHHPDHPRLATIRDGSGNRIISKVLSNIAFIPENPLTGKGGMRLDEAIYFLFKQEGHIFEVRTRGDSLFLQV